MDSNFGTPMPLFISPWKNLQNFFRFLQIEENGILVKSTYFLTTSFRSYISYLRVYFQSFFFEVARVGAKLRSNFGCALMGWHTIIKFWRKIIIFRMRAHAEYILTLPDREKSSELRVRRPKIGVHFRWKKIQVDGRNLPKIFTKSFSCFRWSRKMSLRISPKKK